MRKLLLILLPLALAGCVQTTLKNPVSGDTQTCNGVAPDINLWSSYPLCVEEWVSEGYRQAN